MRQREISNIGKIIFIIGTAILFIMLAAIALYLKLKPDPVEAIVKRPEDTFWQYVEHLKNHNYAEIYELLDEQSRQRYTEDDFVTRNKNIYEGIEAENIAAVISKIQDDVDTTVITYSMSMDSIAGEISFLNNAFIITDEAGDFG